MLGGDEVDVVAFSHVLQLHIPVGELLRCEVEAVALVGDVMVLTEYLDASIRQYVLDRFSKGEGVHIADYTRRRRRCQSHCGLVSRALGAVSHHCIRTRRRITLSKVRRNRIDFHVLSTNQANARLLVAIHTTQSRTQIAVAQMCICLRALLRGIDGADEVVARDVVVEEPGWR